MWALWRKNERFDPGHINPNLKQTKKETENNSRDNTLKENSTSTEVNVLRKIVSGKPETSLFENKVNELLIEVDGK